jgi:zinc protease
MNLTDRVRTAVLDNGLQVLLYEVHRVPIVAFLACYRVGSRHEAPGYTGISHWVEHMLFKGTTTYPQGDFDRLIQREGGLFNGFTWIDWTFFCQVLPADRIELALRIEADRMVNGLFDPQEVETERGVILAEREGHENQPRFRLREQVHSLSFVRHPYRHPIIGWKEDLQRLTRDDLYRHYRAYYVPNNALIVAVGDFETDAMLDRIAGHFGSQPAGPTNGYTPPPEPSLGGERRVHLTGPTGTAYLHIAFRAPPAQHPDYFPLLVMNTVLNGPNAKAAMGSGVGRAARLYRHLVNTGLAVHVDSGLSMSYDPYLFQIRATVHPDHSPAEVEAALLGEIERLQETPVREEELARAIKQLRAELLYTNEHVASLAMLLGHSTIVGSPVWSNDFLSNIAAVTAADVQRVAQTYFGRENRVVGWYTSTETAHAS